MKLRTCFLLLLGFLVLNACNKDDDDGISGDNVVQVDSGNVTGPLLEAGNYETAVRFSAAMMNEHAGKKVDEVIFFMGNVPASATIKIYDEGSADAPGSLLYSADVTNAVSAGEWERHRVTRSIDISGDELWVALAFEHELEMQSMGCDSGPRVDGGDMIYDEANGFWESYLDRTSSAERINWNIRLKVD